MSPDSVVTTGRVVTRRLFERAGIRVLTFPLDFQASASAGNDILDLLPSAAALKLQTLVCRELYGLYYSLFRS